MSDGTNPKAMPEFVFVVQETYRTREVVAANSYDEARRLVEEMYDNGEISLEHNCFEGAEFLPRCSKCDAEFQHGDDWREVDSGTSDAAILCEDCLSELKRTGTLADCGNCCNVFSRSWLEVNLRNGRKEVCPYCGRNVDK